MAAGKTHDEKRSAVSTSRPEEYPEVPVYGQNAPHGSFAPPVPHTPTASHTPPAPAGSSSGVWLSVAAGIVFNVVSLLGVLVFGWPPGNVFALFWIENAVLGLVTLVKVASARAPSTKGITVNGRNRPGSPLLFAAFFTFHYGLFCVVHGVFTGIIAWKIGFEASFALLGLPVILLAIRYTVETLTTWIGPDGLRWKVSSQQAMMAPYPRIIVLHLAAILGFVVVINGGLDLGVAAELSDQVLGFLPRGWRSDGVLLVIALLLIKTVVDVRTTLKAVRPR